MTSTLAETPNTTVPTPTAPTAPTITSTSPTLETMAQKPLKPSRTIRIHVNLKDQPRPVVFNYRQLYKRELKKIETLQETDVPMPSALDSADDLFYQELLKKAESYAMDDDDADDDDGSDEEASLHKKVVGNEYDFEDPFIDDSEMLLDEPHEYSAPEFDGFFVYHGPLDGHDGSEKKTTTPKRKAPAKSKASISTTTANGTATASTTAATNVNSKKAGPSNSSMASTNDGKSRGKKTADNDGDTVPNSQKPKKSINATSGLPGTTATASTKSTTTNNKAASSSIVSKKASSTSDQPAKKRKKLDSKDDETRKPLVSTTAPLSATPSIPTEDSEKKKKPTASSELKPLDPEIEALMEKLRRDVKYESFENKAKFPLSLKPTVLEAGLITFRKYRTIDENLVHHLMTILPYNRFTLKKFLTTKSGQMRVDELQQEIDELAIQLKQTIDRMMPEQQRLFNEKLAQAQASSNEPSNVEEEPTPKFKCNDEVRKILYDIIQTEEQSIHISNQVALHKDSEKKPEGLASDNKARKLMYQRLLSCWPEGWMHSYEMSRQYSQYKSKISASTEKKAALPHTPKANVNVEKKRKRVTPQSSPSDEGFRKKQSIMQDVVPPDASNFQKQLNKAKPHITSAVITIDTDDENDDEAASNWKQPSSMKIESLISGVDHQNIDKKAKPFE